MDLTTAPDQPPAKRNRPRRGDIATISRPVVDVLGANVKITIQLKDFWFSLDQLDKLTPRDLRLGDQVVTDGSAVSMTIRSIFGGLAWCAYHPDDKGGLYELSSLKRAP